MKTDPKSSVDILEHVTEGGVHVETFHSPHGHRRPFESIVAVVETDTYSDVHRVMTLPSSHRRSE